MRNWSLKFIIVCIWSLFLTGCGSSFNQKNYEECLPHLEDARQDVRLINHHSYEHDDFNDCRRPAHLRIEDNEDDD